MPTVILLDASLSMLRPIECGRSSYEQKRKRHKITIDNSNVNGTNENMDIGLEGSRNISNKPFVSSGIQLMDLAKWGIDKLLSHFDQTYKLEQVAVLSYSSQCDLVAPFTRDISEVRGKVMRKLPWGYLLVKDFCDPSPQNRSVKNRLF